MPIFFTVLWHVSPSVKQKALYPINSTDYRRKLPKPTRLRPNDAWNTDFIISHFITLPLSRSLTLCPHCAKRGLVSTHFLRCDCSNYCVPIQLCFTLKMLDCCLNLPCLPCGRSFPGGGWFSGWSQERSSTIGRCARAVRNTPKCITRSTVAVFSNCGCPAILHHSSEQLIQQAEHGKILLFPQV